MSRFISAVCVKDFCKTEHRTLRDRFFSVTFVHVNVSFLFMGNECITEGSRASRTGMKVWQIKITPQSLTNLLRRRRSSFARLMDGWGRWPEQDDKENICLQGQKGCSKDSQKVRKKNDVRHAFSGTRPQMNGRCMSATRGVWQVAQQKGNRAQK